MRAIFLDRDGTIIYDVGYINSPEFIRILPGTIDGLKKLQKLGFSLFIVTNQSGIRRGYLSFERYREITRELIRRLASEHITIRSVEFCPDHPSEATNCRKPSPLMVERLIERFSINRQESFFIGDRETDVEAGLNAGIRAILISDHPISTRAEFVARNLKEAADYIEKVL